MKAYVILSVAAVMALGFLVVSLQNDERKAMRLATYVTDRWEESVEMTERCHDSIEYQRWIEKQRAWRWVMQNSSRISEETALEIVEQAFETKFPFLLLALMRVESSFDPNSVSSTGAAGLGQVMFRWHGEKLKEAGIIADERDLFNIREGIRAAEHVWIEKLGLANGDPLRALYAYLGAGNTGYAAGVLSGYFQLRSGIF